MTPQNPAQDVSDSVLVPTSVLDLYRFMDMAFTPTTRQQEEIALQLRVAKADMEAARELQQPQVVGELVTRPVAPHAANNAPSPSVQLTATPQSSAPVVGELPPPYAYLHLDTSTEKWTVHDEPGLMRVAVWTKHLIESALTGRG